MPVVTPDTKPPTSETPNQRQDAMRLSGSGVFQARKRPPDRYGRVNSPILPDTPGELVSEPPCSPTNSTLAMNRATPGARMLMANPATMWLTPNVTVANPRRSPPSSPPSAPPRTPNQGPCCQANQPPNTVPAVIMPSSPMLTVPLRSDHRPARPAMAIGAATRIATPNVPGEVMSSVLLIHRAMATETTTSRPPHAHSGPGSVDDERDGATGAGPASSATAVMLVVLRCERRGASRGVASNGLRGRGTP